jgi:hypothetical protein
MEICVVLCCFIVSNRQHKTQYEEKNTTQKTKKISNTNPIKTRGWTQGPAEKANSPRIPQDTHHVTQIELITRMYTAHNMADVVMCHCILWFILFYIYCMVNYLYMGSNI